jgi:hypothetical protein
VTAKNLHNLTWKLYRCDPFCAFNGREESPRDGCFGAFNPLFGPDFPDRLADFEPDAGYRWWKNVRVRSWSQSTLFREDVCNFVPLMAPVAGDPEQLSLAWVGEEDRSYFLKRTSYALG